MPDRRARPIGCLIAIVVLALALLFGWTEYRRLVREQPELFPWTPLSLADPIGQFTGRKLARLADDPARCLALVRPLRPLHRRAPARSADQGQCGYRDGLRLGAGEDAIRYRPDGIVTACPVAAALALWEREVVQPAARRHLGGAVAAVDHAGSYSCRRLYGRPDGPYSEHATANALDITGFRLADGRRVSVLSDWNGDPARAAFLRAVRDGGCDLFSTVLSPDYNRAHADHLHLDQARRGATGWRGCR